MLSVIVFCIFLLLLLLTFALAMRYNVLSCDRAAGDLQCIIIKDSLFETSKSRICHVAVCLDLSYLSKPLSLYIAHLYSSGHQSICSMDRLDNGYLF